MLGNHKNITPITVILIVMAQLKSTSHMLKHAVGTHHGQDMSEVKFGMRVLKYTRTSFERQIALS